MRRLVPIALLAALAALAGGAVAQPISVEAYVNRTTLGDGEELVFTVEVSGSFQQADYLSGPQTRGLVGRGTAPLRSWSVTRRNGRTEQRIELRWFFQPTRVGEAEIGPVTVEVDGRRYSTSRIRVTVVPQAQRPQAQSRPAPVPAAPAGGTPDLFLSAEPDRTTAYVGQQVAVDYVLYYRSGIQPRNARLASAWEAPGFWREDLQLPTPPPARSVIVDGEPYEAVTVRRAAFFPTRSGRLAIDSLAITLDVLRGRRPGGTSGLFYNPFGARYERERVVAPTVALEIRALPEGAPPGFGGAVGSFNLQASTDRAEAAPGEPVRVTLTVTGDGNLATLPAPAWPVPPAFEQYPAEAATDFVRIGPRLEGSRRFTYTLVPRVGGLLEVPAVRWTYFDPQARAYRTLTSEPIPLRVLGGAAPLAEAEGGAEAGFRLTRTALAWRPVRPLVPMYQRPAVIAGFAFPLLALLALVAIRTVRDWRSEDSPRARRSRALRTARTSLREADGLERSGDLATAAAAREAAVRDFLAERLGRPARALPLDELGAELRVAGVSEGTCHDLMALLEMWEVEQFAPVRQGERSPSARTAELLVAVDAEAAPLSSETP